MNDLTFTNYENYFSASHQTTDITVQHTEYDEIAPTIHYLNNVSCDIEPLSQTSSLDQRHQQTSLFNFMPNTRAEQSQKLNGQCTSDVAGSGGGLANMGNSGTVFGSIPFVQIHTTDVHPQRTSYGNVFRRNISKQEEIKSEPIKSENADAAKDRINATPTPPRASIQAQNENNVEGLATNDKTSTTNITNNSIEEKSSSLLQIYKCSKCPFISLRQTERDDHVSAEHGENDGCRSEQRQPINCLGCSNVFFNQKSLELHLKLDHLMIEGDISKVIDALKESTTKSAEEPVRKSRIYLKNVDCLREPNRQPMEQNLNRLTENKTCNALEAKRSNAPKQKISIKSVDVLREPALLRRDYEMQSSNVNNFINFNADLLNNNMDLDSSPLNLNATNNYEYTPTLDNSISSTSLNNDSSCLVNSSNTHENMQVLEKPRRPKIYVKSVESFNLMPVDSIRTSNDTAYLSNHSSTSNNSQAYESTVTHLPYIFDSSSTANNLNNNVNFISNHNEMESFQFMAGTSNANNNYILDNTLFLGNDEELNENCDQMENITLVSDTNTPTPPAPVETNLIMNKPVSTIQEQRGTLHLRTVDELNLMNKTEVQHLIAPNLDNNHCVEALDKVNTTSLNDISLIGDDLYTVDNFKFHDLDTQMVNNWPDTYEDLADDISYIIADASNENSAHKLTYSSDNNNQLKNSSNFDIDTPQVSLITIRDIEELTGAANHAAAHIEADQQPDSVIEKSQNGHNEVSTEMDIANQEAILDEQGNPETVSDSNLKRELVNATPESNETAQVMEITEKNCPNENTKKTLTTEVPPLVPVTKIATNESDHNLHSSTSSTLPSTDIPLPPLVPVSSMARFNSVFNKPTNKSTPPLEKGRIYVANNLMEPPKRLVAVSATSGTSVRGRPFGSNRTCITKLKQTIGSSAEDLFSKCSVKGCAFRFKKTETVEYHRRCHDTISDSPQAMICPECKSTDFNNWNTLHTHLWRAHQVDMELYKCELCDFKTPIFSRLVNTHAKIHFDDRNYKCEQCEKAFKNSKQLKNHRRWHRVQAATVDVPNIQKPTPAEIHRCLECGSTFSQLKTLREHCCKKGDSSLKCSVCAKLLSSKSSLKLHLLTHSDGAKRYKCQNCDYATNDHNAFRRHRMGHENRKMYDCNFCPYKSVQSVAYQRHILQKHPEKADSVIHKCRVCSYSTVNRALLIVHQAKHEPSPEDVAKIINVDQPSTPKSAPLNAIEHQKNKIKVKSNLFTVDVAECLTNISNDFSFMQLCNMESGSSIT